MSRLSMKDGRIVLDEQNEKPKSTMQKTSASNSRLSMVDGRIVLADKPVEKAANNQPYLQKTRTAQQQYQAMDDVLPQRNNVMDMAIDKLRDQVSASNTSSAAGPSRPNSSNALNASLKNSGKSFTAPDEWVDENGTRHSHGVSRGGLGESSGRGQTPKYTSPVYDDAGRNLYENDYAGDDMSQSTGSLYDNDYLPDNYAAYNKEYADEKMKEFSLPREERDKIINDYKAAAEAYEANPSDAESYRAAAAAAEAAGGIEKLIKEQQRDAERDIKYQAELDNIDVDSMSRLERFGTAFGGFISGTGALIGERLLGLTQSGINTAALNANRDDSITSIKSSLEFAARNWYHGLVNGTDNAETEAEIRKLAEYVGGKSYADKIVSAVRERAKQVIDGSAEDTTYGLLDGIEPGSPWEGTPFEGMPWNGDSKLWTNLQKSISDYNAVVDQVGQYSRDQLKLAGEVNNMQDIVGANTGYDLVKAVSQVIPNAVDMFVAKGLGLAGTKLAYIPFALGAYGGSYAEKIRQFMQDDSALSTKEAKQASSDAAVSAGIEVLTEMIWEIGGFMNSGGSPLDEAVQNSLNKYISDIAKTPAIRKTLEKAAEYALGFETEKAEEVLGSVLSRILSNPELGNLRLLHDEYQEYPEWKEQVKEEGKLGGLGGLLGFGTRVATSSFQQSEAGRQLKNGGITLNDGTKVTVDDMVNLANSPGMEGTTLEKTYSSLLDGTPRAIDSFSDRELGKLYEAYEETLGKSEEAVKRVDDIAEKVAAGEELSRADVNRITNNPDAVRYLRTIAGEDVDLTGDITERKAAVNNALQAFASQNEALSAYNDAIDNLVQENANTARLQNQVIDQTEKSDPNIAELYRQMEETESDFEDRHDQLRETMPSRISENYFSDSTAQAVRDAANRAGFSKQEQEALVDRYSGPREEAEKRVQVYKYYNQGRNDVAFDLTQNDNDVLSPEEKKYLWNIGRIEKIQEDAKNGIAKDGEVHLHESGERNDGAYSAGTPEAVAEGAGGNQAGQSGYQQLAATAQRLRPGAVGPQIKTKGASGQAIKASMAKAGYRIVEDANDADYAKAKKIADENGYDLVAWRGSLANFEDAPKARGMCMEERNADGSIKKITIFVQLDNLDFTAEQIAIHESTHGKIKEGKIKLGEVKRKMIKALGGEDEFDAALDAYADAYYKAGVIEKDENGKYSEDDLAAIFEEMACDAPAGMNAFSELQQFDRAVSFRPVMEAAKSATENKNPNGTRGSPSATEINNGYTARAMEETVDNPVKASISIADAVAERSVAAVPKDNETLQAAVQKAHDDIRNILIPIVKPLMGKMDKNGMPLVPEESSFSPNIFSNGSYGFDAEPTTECYRQMGYRALAKMVTDKLGRPLTNIEAIIVNQAAVEIAIDPPCLYCYSLLDRKAKEAYKIQYLNERDSFEQMFERDYGKDRKALLKDIDKQLNPDVNSGSYYSIYLNNGKGTRTDNKDKKARVRLWMEMWANNIKGVSMLDVRNMEAEEATAKHYDEIQNKTVRDFKKRSLKDVQAWVQAASQAKKYIPYSAYTNAGKGNLLSWKQNRIDLLNSEYGLRWYSHAYFHPAFAIDNMQQVIDASVRGLKGLMYCKPIAAAKIMAPTGMNINVSCFAQFKDGKYISDDKLGANWDEVKDLRKKYNNVGSVMVVTSDDMLLWALSQDWVDVVIPLHRVRSGSEFIQEFGLSDYTGQQADKADKAKFDEFMAAYAAEHQLTDRQAASAGKKMKSVYPAEHQNDYDTYLKICQERGLTPRFEKIRSEILTGNYSYDGVKLTPAMYMKLVNETRQSESQTQPLQPKFDMKAAEDAVRSLETQGYFEYFKDASEWNGKRMTLNDWANQAAKDIEAGKKPSELGYGRDLAVNEKGQYIVSSRQAKAEGLSGIHKASLVLQYLNGDTEVVNKPSNITENQARYYLGLAKRRVLDDDSYIPVKRNTSKVVVDSLNAAGIRVYDDPLIMSVRKARQAQRHTDINNEEGHKLGIDEIIMLLSRLDSPAHIIYQTNRRDKRTGRKLPNNVAVFVAYPDGGKERFAVVEFDADIRENVFVDDGDNNFSVVVTLFVPGPKTNKAESGEAGNDKENNEVEEYDYYLKLLSSPDNREIPIKYRDTDATGDNGEIVPDAETTDISVQQQYGTGGEESQSLKTGNPVAQAISSADTSLNQVPALHKDSRVEWGKTNIDIGAGAYEAATEYLKEKGVTNLKWDPYNQSEDVNRATLKYLQDGNKADTATNANVLNVIAEKDARLNVVLQAAKSIKPDGKAYFMVYEGDGSGIGRRTSKGWQNNLKTKEYADEIRTYFNDVQVKGKLIVASNPKANLPMASWEVTPGNAVKFSTSLSSAYMAAAERGDTETAQRLVDEAAEEAMPNSEIRNKNGKLLKVYHGTDADFNVFDTTVSGGKNGRAEGFGIYLSPDQEVTKSYGDRQIGMFANITKPAYSNRKTISVTKLKALLKSTCEAEAKEMAEDYGGSVKDALKDTWISNYVDTYSNSMEIAYTKAAQDILRMNGSDMEVIQEVMAGMAIREYADAIAFYNDHLTPVTGFDGFWTEWTNRETGKKTPVILAFNSNQLKVADAITRNDDGNIIPLEERFNPKNDDIRFSRDLTNRTSSELYEANRQLQKDVTELRQQLKTKTEQYKYWKGQTKVTEGRQLRIEDVTKLAREIIKDQESSVDAKTVAEKMKALGEYLLNSQDENVYDEARLKAYEVAHDILANAKTLNTKGGDDFYSDFRTALKNQPIYVAPSVREEVAPDGWNDFRKARYGTVNMTADQSKGKTVDTVYHDLQATFGEWLLPEYITSEADQLNKILEIIETYRPVYENLNSYEMADAVEWTANEILTRIIGEEIRETNPTYADRMEKKLADQKAKAQTALKQVRQQRDRKVADLKAHYQQVAEDRRNRKIDSEMRSRLLKIAKRLNNKKLDRVTRGLLDQYIGELDLVSKGILDRTIKDIEHLNDFYNAYKEKMGADFIEDISIKNRIDRLSKKHINDLTQEEVAELTTVLLNFENMLRTKDKLLESQIKSDVYAAGMQTIDDISNSNGKTGFLAEYIGAETASPERYIHRITGYRENSPLYQAAKELSDGQRKMLDYQRRAEALFKKWTTDKKFIRRIAGKHAEAITARGYVDGVEKELNITPAMAMSLYLHAKNDDNMRHISQGGVMIPDMDLYLKGKLQDAYAKGERVVFTRSMIAKITSQLDEKEIAFADAVGRYYNTMSRDEINDVSEILKGFAIAGVENYFPIDTNGNFLAKTFDTIKRDGSIEGMGFLKERIDNASTPIMLYDLNTILNRSISQHSKYVGLAIPVRNFEKLYNVTTFTDNGVNFKANPLDPGWRYDTSIATTLEKNWGKAATSYVAKMMADIENGTGLKDDKWGDLLAKARSKYAGAVLTTNASVAMKQAASYPTAAAVVGYKALGKALADFRKYGDKTVDMDKLAEYTPLYWYRSKGFSTTELGDIGKEGGHIPKALNWIQGIDMLTTRKLAKAAMYYVEDNNKALVKGTDAWWKEVAKVYNRIIEETQPNYTMMQRPQILRSDNALTRALNMFKTQPFQNFNILYDAFGNLAAKSREYKANATEENLQSLKSARTNAVRAVSSQAVSALVFALMQWAWDAFRGKVKKYRDDDDEKDLLSWLKGMGINVLSSVGGMIPFGSYALELGETMTDAILKAFKLDPFFDQTFYGLSENAAESVNDMGNAMINMVTKTAQALSGSEVTESTVRSVVDSMGDIAQFAGIPVNNVIKLAQSIGRNIYLATEGKYVGGYHALRLTTDPARYSSDYYDLLWKAYKNDKAAYDEVLQLMLDGGFEEDKIKSAMEKRMKEAQGVSSVKDLESRWMAPSQQTTYDAGISALEQTNMWQAATDEQQQAVMTKLYNIALGNSTGQKLEEKIQGGASVGLNQTEYMLYTLALSMVDKPTESGKYGSYTNEEVEAAILMVPGLSKEERAYLWEAAGKTTKSNPWR